jgi:hypothetical protein
MKRRDNKCFPIFNLRNDFVFSEPLEHVFAVLHCQHVIQRHFSNLVVMSIRTECQSKRHSGNYRLQQNSSSCPGMQQDEGRALHVPHIAGRHATKGFDPQATNIDSMNTMDMDAIDHAMEPTVLAPLCSFQSIAMPAPVIPGARVELYCTRSYMKLGTRYGH